jgi:hypothetical protein
MALPGSGELSLGDIAGELGVGLSNVSLRSMSSTAGKSTPDAVSEFYGYSAAVTYTYHAFYLAGFPCNDDGWNIYYGSDGKYYRQVFIGVYALMYSYTDLWYEYQYYEPLFDANVYKEWEVNAASTSLTDNGNTVAVC